MQDGKVASFDRGARVAEPEADPLCRHFFQCLGHPLRRLKYFKKRRID